jgi:nitroreductase
LVLKAGYFTHALEPEMNEVLKTIFARRSVRRFSSEQVKQEDVDSIIEAGLYAPSASNAQDWHFTVVQRKELIEQINKWILDEIENGENTHLQELVKMNGGRFFRNAPTVIVISTQTKDRFAVINAAAATENILIAAESLGIGSCWTGTITILSKSKAFESYARELQLPDGYTPQFAVTLGHKDAPNPPAPPRKKNLVSFIL